MPAARLFLALSFAWAVAVVVAVHALDFAGSVADFARASGGGALLDTRPVGSEAEIHARIASYGERGRNNYAFRNRTVDVLLPLSLLPLLFLLMREALGRLAIRGRARRALLLIPSVYPLFDLAENAAVLALLASFPERAPVAALLLPHLTLIKRAGLMLGLGLPLAALGIAHLRGQLAHRL